MAYLLVPDLRAVRQIESLRRMWVAGRVLPKGLTPWRDVFACLRDLRVWGPADRVQPLDADILAEEIEGLVDNELVPLEIELVFRSSPEAGAISKAAVTALIIQSGGLRIGGCRPGQPHSQVLGSKVLFLYGDNDILRIRIFWNIAFSRAIAPSIRLTATGAKCGDLNAVSKPRREEKSAACL